MVTENVLRTWTEIRSFFGRKNFIGAVFDLENERELMTRVFKINPNVRTFFVTIYYKYYDPGLAGGPPASVYVCLRHVLATRTLHLLYCPANNLRSQSQNKY